MFKAFTQNSKTILSIDFDRFKTCPQICDYCYVGNMERIYPSYKEKIERNYEWAKDRPADFAQTLNTEYLKARKSSSAQLQRLEKLPVRIYGSGDYVKHHYEFMKELDFKFYIISKSLTDPGFYTQIDKVIQLDNLTTVCLSFDQQNLINYKAVSHLYKKDKIKFAYTGAADEFNVIKDTYSFDIFFNTSNKKIEKEKSRQIKEQCPCDSGALTHAKSCSVCSKCWRSTVTKEKQWNTTNTQTP
ncbi:MAG: hypothetical protein H8E12_07765 [Rhodobacteraceae bacterium]|nr:hypothetical protein [Paracoccaceae bacterium]